VQAAWVQANIIPLLSAHPRLAPVGTAILFGLALLHDPKAQECAKEIFGAGKNMAVAIILPLLFSTLVCGPLVGCTQAQRVGVAQEIVNWTPAFTSAIDTAGNAAELLLVVDPGASLIVKTVVTGVDLLAPQFVIAAKAYLANPNQTTLQVLQALIVQIQNGVNAQLLAAAKITNPTTQQQVLTAINGIGTIVNTLLGLIQSVSSTAQVESMQTHVTVTLAMVQRQLDLNAMERASLQVSADLRLEQPIHAQDWLQSEMAAGF
jgi:hypothetical protein